MTQIEFVSYDGDYPNLCAGTLVIKVEGVEFKLPHALASGGHVWFDDDWNEHVIQGLWRVKNLPEELEPFRKEITDLVNKNVEHGCCGGCV